MPRQTGRLDPAGSAFKASTASSCVYSTPERQSVDKFRERRGIVDEGEHIEELPPPQHASIDFGKCGRVACLVPEHRIENGDLGCTLGAVFCRPGRRSEQVLLDDSTAAGCAHALFSSPYPGFGFNPAASMPAMAQISSLSDVSPDTPIAPRTEVPSWIRTPPGTGTRRPCASAFTELMK